MAKRAETALNASPSDHVIIARVGSDISEHGLKYTHLGIAERREGGAHWRVIHQLNPCGTGASVLRRDGLGVFLSDDWHRHDLLVAPFTPAISKALSRTMDTGHPAALHEPRYSMIAHPGPGARYQNSNQWILEGITQAIMIAEGQPRTDRNWVQRRYRQDGFRGSIVKVGLLKRAGARIGAPNIRFDDHPARARAAGRFEVVTVDAVITHLTRTKMIVGHRELNSRYARAIARSGQGV
ncbi:MAG: DUF2145 domain-containing protein [Alphaproteobacteria bacterium]|nr:DUF2145 domain-containing protein [Alphaproteobacteria bacterium]